MLVLDEAQIIKNPDSQTTKAAFELSAPFKLASLELQLKTL